MAVPSSNCVSSAYPWCPFSSIFDQLIDSFAYVFVYAASLVADQAGTDHFAMRLHSFTLWEVHFCAVTFIPHRESIVAEYEIHLHIP